MHGNAVVLLQFYAVLLKIGCADVKGHVPTNLEDSLPIADTNVKFNVDDHHHFYPDEPPPFPPVPPPNTPDIEQEGFIPIVERVKEIKLPRLRRAVTARKERLWPNATVPYIMHPNTSENVKTNIHAAMKHWESNTCIRFVPRTSEKNYIEFASGKCGCCSYVGRQNRGRQFVNISENCGVFGVIVHELGHTIGFWHEHSRPDRDKYIRIIVENIKAGRMENFHKKSEMEIDSLGQPYDYKSVMHYRKTTFSSNGGNTMEPQDEGVYIGQRVSLSKGDIVQANLLYDCPKPNCNLEFHETSGNFSSPNYPMYYYKEHNCTWVLHTPQGHSLQLKFHDFQVEKSDNCTFDYVELRLGTSKRGKPVGRLCGVGHPGTLKVWGNLWIHFSSDSTIMLRGFKASFQIAPDGDILGDPLMMADDFLPETSGSGSGDASINEIPYKHYRFEYETDCHRTLTAQQGTIESPLALAMSPTAVECKWTISGGPNATAIYLKIDRSQSRVEGETCIGNIQKRTKIHKTFNTPDAFDRQSFDIESYEPHPYDCGTMNGDTIRLNTTEASIMWSSRYHHGFKLSYVIDYDECRLNSSLCDYKCVNTITGYRCICQSGYRPDDQHINCLPKLIQYADECGKTMTSIRGKLRSSSKPFDECGYEVNLPAHYRIFLIFSQFNIPWSENCTKHFMMVYTGSEHHTKGKLCGTESPGVLTTPNGYIAIRVHVDPLDFPQQPLFTASYIAQQTYQKEACFHRLRGGGNISSPNFPKKYPSHSHCIWKLTVHGEHVVRLQFDMLDIERTKLCHFDYVEVRDGRTRTSPFIGRFCGSKLPKDVYSTGKHMWLMFISDESHAGRGFFATFMPHKLNSSDSTGGHHRQGHHNRNTTKQKEKNTTVTMTESPENYTTTKKYRVTTNKSGVVPVNESSDPADILSEVDTGVDPVESETNRVRVVTEGSLGANVQRVSDRYSEAMETGGGDVIESEEEDGEEITEADFIRAMRRPKKEHRSRG